MKTYVWHDGALYRSDGSYVGSCSWEWAQECMKTANLVFPDVPDMKLEKR